MESCIKPYNPEITAAEFTRNIMRESAKYMGKTHLDIGCGDGSLTRNYPAHIRDLKVIGYDPNPNIINLIKKKYKPSENYIFTSSITDVEDLAFDTASANFVFHEASEDIFKTAYQKLKPDGKFLVVDYNLKYLPFNEFKTVFNSPTEINEINQMGWLETYRLHTSTGPKDCHEIAEKFNFTTLENKPLQSNSKYFMWIGQKQG